MTEERKERKQTVMRILRERAGLKQVDIARMLDRAQPEVSMWEWNKEKMADHVRYTIAGILRARLSEEYPYFEPKDLQRPWDEVVVEWEARRSA